MDDLLVDRDAERSGIAPVALEGRHGSELAGPALGQRVELGRPDARPDERPELPEDPGDDLRAAPHRLDLRASLVDDHPRASRGRRGRDRRSGDPADRGGDGIDRPRPVHGPVNAPASVIGLEGLGLGPVDAQPLPDDRGRVVGPLAQGAAAGVADARPDRRLGGQVVDRLAGIADPAVAQPVDQSLRVDLDADDELRPGRVEVPDGLGLGDRPGEAVEDVAPPAVRRGDALADEPDDDVVADEPAGLHGRRGPEAEGRPVLDGPAEKIAGRDPGQPGRPGQDLALGPLPAAGRAEQDDAHQRRPLTRPWRMNPS